MINTTKLNLSFGTAYIREYVPHTTYGRESYSISIPRRKGFHNELYLSHLSADEVVKIIQSYNVPVKTVDELFV